MFFSPSCIFLLLWEWVKTWTNLYFQPTAIPRKVFSMFLHWSLIFQYFNISNLQKGRSPALYTQCFCQEALNNNNKKVKESIHVQWKLYLSHQTLLHVFCYVPRTNVSNSDRPFEKFSKVIWLFPQKSSSVFHYFYGMRAWWCLVLWTR